MLKLVCDKGCSRPCSTYKSRRMNETQLIRTQSADSTNDLIVRIAIGVPIPVVYIEAHAYNTYNKM